jgi:hypothetical protein
MKRALVVALGIALLGSAGCSMFVVRPPGGYGECTESSEAPQFDAAVAGLFGATALSLGISAAAMRCEGSDCAARGLRVLGALGSLTASIPFIISAARGYSHVRKCREANRAERASAGDPFGLSRP